MENEEGALDVSVTKKFGQKRCSPRLRQQIKRPYYGPPCRSKTQTTDLLSSNNTLSPSPSSSSNDNNNKDIISQQQQQTLLFDFSYVPHTRSHKARVKKTLSIFNNYFLHFSNSNNNNQHPLSQEEEEEEHNRPDFKAVSKMIECNQLLFPTKRFGHLPGIDVGYQLYSRAEMVALGLHTHWHSPIDYMPPSYNITVSECWPAEGVSAGFVVYKYLLKRLEGQPKLTSNQVQCSNGRSRVPAKAPRLVCLDISEGQEDVHIPAVNTVDDATITGFTYTKYNQILSNLKVPRNANGCDCKGGYCKNPKTCSCARLNGVDFPYVRSNGGRLIEAKDVVFECGPNCGCGPGCINRISQQGIKYQLEVFRTRDRGWAVKTKDFIPSGAPVCEYIGELRRTNELDNVAENDYIFEIDCWQTIKEIGGRERRLGDVSLGRRDEKEIENSMPMPISMPMPEPEFCIDAGRIGNVARFINHSCEPNLFVQCVLSSHHDLRLARILLFASDDIAPMEELTYDYGYALDSVVDKNGKVRMVPCHCGTSECRKRLY
ncbi:hypothetical protein M8C21_004194 [Ambrosia artemisiifolia]|uniref:Uncharacterized protein n=1 Tax=Ambrosia artemisiifolia TaxID=4212 RepID=A0AAD5CZ11_AMBAR|nr:hypothetical protein M8C21_004194 [Ambrosia artemisiifolia]